MRKLFENKIFLIGISLLLSFILWLYVVSTVSDEVTRTFTGVRVELVGENVLKDSKGLVVTDLSSSTVAINVSGPRRIVSAISSDDIKAQIDVSKLSQSSYASMQYSISYPSGTDVSGLTVSRKIPETVNFIVSRLTEKEIPVRGSFDGSTAEGYTAEAPVFEPATIVVSGPENLLGNVSYAWVTFASENVESTYSEETNFVLMNESNQKIDSEGLSCSTDVIKATLPILEVKDIRLDVNLVHGAGTDENNVKVTVEPESITLAGDSAILNGLNKINVATIDLTAFESTFSEVYPITIDNDLTNLTGTAEAKVTIEVVGMASESFKVTNLEIANLTEGFSAEILSKSFDVRLRGLPEELQNVKAENIRAVADLTDYNETTGLQLVPVKIYVDGVTNVGAVGSYTISVEIKKELK